VYVPTLVSTSTFIPESTQQSTASCHEPNAGGWRTAGHDANFQYTDAAHTYRCTPSEGSGAYARTRCAILRSVDAFYVTISCGGYGRESIMDAGRVPEKVFPACTPNEALHSLKGLTGVYKNRY
jgi:hypothetical protein